MGKTAYKVTALRKNKKAPCPRPFSTQSYHPPALKHGENYVRSDSRSGRTKKDAEASKTASSPYRRTAETVFGGSKSENVISPFEGIRKDSDIIPQIRLY